MIRVGDLDRSVKFYTEVMGMTLLRQNDYPEDKFTLAFLGYDQEQVQLELTNNWGTDSYDLGSGYGHIAIAVDDIHEAVEQMRQRGATIDLEPEAMGNSLIAFIKDPDGYRIELIGSTR